MPSTNATFPLRARSMMSPPARGQSRTRLPFASSAPPTTTLWSAGLSSYSRKKSSILRPQHPDITEGTVQSHEFLRRERLTPLQYLPPPRVGGAHLLFLLVREVEDVQDEHLVDLGPVKQVTGALGRDLRVVREDDRGGEQHVPLPFLSGGSVSETNSPASTSRVVWVETKVCLSVLSLSSPAHGVVLVILTVTLKIPSCRSSAPTPTAPRSGRQLRTRAPTTSPVGSVSGSSLLPPRTSTSACLGDPSSSESLKRPSAISRSAASSHGR